MRDGHLRGTLSQSATLRHVDVLVAYGTAGGSVPDAAKARGHPAEHGEAPPADLRRKSGLTTEQLIRTSRWMARCPEPGASMSDSNPARLGFFVPRAWHEFPPREGSGSSWRSRPVALF